MLWLNTLIALFLGGFIGTLVGIEYHLPIPFSMIVGAIVGGLAYKPRELMHFARLALSSATKVDYWFLMKKTKKVFVVIFFLILGFLVAGLGFCLNGLTTLLLMESVFPSSFMTSESSLLGFLLLGLMFSNIFFFVWIVDKEMPRHSEWLAQFTNRGDTVFIFLGFAFAEGGILGIPIFITFMLTRWAPASCLYFFRGIIQLWFDIPDIALYFAQLATTHDRITIMISTAVGVAIGISSERAVVGGLTAIAVGTAAVLVSKYMVKHHPASVAESA
ncbi:MAG: hypothetical protein AAB690_00170 [Patescibacteria group bacterium]